MLTISIKPENPEFYETRTSHLKAKIIQQKNQECTSMRDLRASLPNNFSQKGNPHFKNTQKDPAASGKRKSKCGRKTLVCHLIRSVMKTSAREHVEGIIDLFKVALQ